MHSLYARSFIAIYGTLIIILNAILSQFMSKNQIGKYTFSR